MNARAPALTGLPATEGPFVIAEAGVNHNGDAALAMRMVDAARDAGAHAIKFQTFVPELLASPVAPRAAYQRGDGEDGGQLDMVRRLALGRRDFEALAAHCARRGIVFLSTPFDVESARFLCDLGVPVLKIPSGEITNPAFLRATAGFGRPLILSTGMADLGEVEAAVEAVESAGCGDYALLHCTSNYPASACDANLRAIPTLARTFGCPVGYSDHTLGIDVAIAATALGASIIEKHFTLDRNLSGPDHRASLEPGELKAMAEAVARTASALGDGVKHPARSEAPIAAVARRSLAAARAMPAGARLEDGDLLALRPGTGIAPFEASRVVGRRLRVAVAARMLIDWSMLE